MSATPTPPTAENAMQAHKNDQVTAMFTKWVQGQVRHGVDVATIASDIAKHAKPKYGLDLDGPIKVNAATDVREFAFVGTKLVIRYNGSVWELA
jgi:hypothetical protein